MRSPRRLPASALNELVHKDGRDGARGGAHKVDPQAPELLQQTGPGVRSTQAEFLSGSFADASCEEGAVRSLRGVFEDCVETWRGQHARGPKAGARYHAPSMLLSTRSSLDISNHTQRRKTQTKPGETSGVQSPQTALDQNLNHYSPVKVQHGAPTASLGRAMTRSQEGIAG